MFIPFTFHLQQDKCLKLAAQLQFFFILPLLYSLSLQSWLLHLCAPWFDLSVDPWPSSYTIPCHLSGNVISCVCVVFFVDIWPPDLFFWACENYARQHPFFSKMISGNTAVNIRIITRTLWFKTCILFRWVGGTTGHHLCLGGSPFLDR